MFTILCGFIPQYRIDSYIKKVVLRKTTDEEYLLDIYFSEYLERYNNEHKFFVSELKRIYDKKDYRSSILDIDGIKFTTNKAFGSDDDIVYNIFLNNFLKIEKFDGNYVLIFSVKNINKHDLIELVYDETSAKKFNNNVRRINSNNAISYNDIDNIEENKKKDDRYYKEYKALMDELDGE